MLFLFMHSLDKILSIISSYTNGPAFICILLGTGLFLTFYLGFPQFRYFLKSIKIILGKDSTDTSKGDASPFQTLATSLGGSIGVGSIPGVGIAINIGGPSSLFWMVITAILAMATNLAEVILCHRYREKSEDGTLSGGPMYYMKKGLNMRYMAGFFSIMTIFTAFGVGNLPQVNSIAKSIFKSFGVAHAITGIFLVIVVGFIILGGIKRIANVAEKITPFMSLIYFIIAMCVISKNYQQIIPAIRSIAEGIFHGSAASGGFLGASVALAINTGTNRSFFCNGSGSGTIGITHAASTESNSLKEGVLSIIEPFISTIIMCMLTGFVILCAKDWNKRIWKDFDFSDTEIVQKVYMPSINKVNREDISNDTALPDSKINFKENQYVDKKKHIPFDGKIEVVDGKLVNENIVVINSGSLAKNVVFKSIYKDRPNGYLPPYNGLLKVNAGKIVSRSISMHGESILSGIDLCNLSFSKGFLGSLGTKLMTLCLILFAFTTIMAYYYYGDRAVIYLGGGRKSIFLYKFVFIVLLFTGTVTEATLVWRMSDITYALMAIPNLFGLLLLSRKVKRIIQNEKENLYTHHR